jgi:16S rRNA (guanine1516-N2)-methyltransferase
MTSHSLQFCLRECADAAAMPLPAVVARLPRDCSAGTTHVFWHGAQGLALGPVGLPYQQATRVDFSDPTLLYRLRTSGKRQGIGKAVGLDKAKDLVRVLDATAGLGRDALVLAHLGCEVELMERSPWVHALLEDGLRRAHDAEQDIVREAASRMRLVHGDAKERLRALAGSAGAPDVIYLDPMFPPRRKSAAVKKDIGTLQGLLGPDEDLEELLALALAVARKRVVVKRPPDQAEIAGPPPTFTLGGKATHFSIYVNSGFGRLG